MFNKEKKALKALLGRQYIEFPTADAQRVAALKAALRMPRDMVKGVNDPTARYTVEYTGDHYHSYKPGIDDARLQAVFAEIRVE